MRVTQDRERDDNVQADVTRVVIDALPRLFAQHQTVPARIVDILSIPRLIKLDLYLDMQMLSVSHSSLVVDPSRNTDSLCSRPTNLSGTT